MFCCEDNMRALLTKPMAQWDLDKTLQIVGPSCLVWNRWKILEETYKTERRSETVNWRYDRASWAFNLFNSWQGIVIGFIDQFQGKTSQNRNCLKRSFGLASYVASMLATLLQM